MNMANLGTFVMNMRTNRISKFGPFAFNRTCVELCAYLKEGKSHHHH